MTNAILEAHVHLYRDSRTPEPIAALSIAQALERIQHGHYRQPLQDLRRILAEQGKPAYDRAKRTLEAITFCGTFAPKRGIEHLQQHSAIVHGDLDYVGNVEAVKREIAADPRTVYAFLSPSGAGLKVGVHVSIVPDDAAYKHVWYMVAQHYQSYGGSWDPSGKDISRLCFVSDDPDLYVNPHASVFEVPPATPPAARPHPIAPSVSHAPTETQDDAARAVRTATEKIQAAPLGTRHPTRLKASRLLGGYVADGMLSYQDALAALSQALEGHTENMAAALKTIEDGLAYGQAYPITPQALEAERVAWIEAHRTTSRPRQTAHDTPPTHRTIPMDHDAQNALGSTNGTAEASQAPVDPDDWTAGLYRTKSGISETYGNIMLAVQHLEPWANTCWYDEVRDLCMVGETPLDDQQVSRVAVAIEAQVRIPIRSLSLVGKALTARCYHHRRDLLREWLEALDPWDQTPRLDTWLADDANAAPSPYSQDVGRVLLVSMIARALEPGCQYRFVVILEGPENAGKTKLVRALGTPEWYRELSHGLDGKEAHMRIKRAWVAELAELASFPKTESRRLKSFFTSNEDAYIPKFSNFEVVHKRRAIFVGTCNPTGLNDYLEDQTGNTRYLPIAVRDIAVDRFEARRTQLFAEALLYYRQHPKTWWQLSTGGESQAQEEREDRRQRSVYEDLLDGWLRAIRPRFNPSSQHQEVFTWWEEIAEQCLKISQDRWVDRRAQMEVAKALKALGWYKDRRQRLQGTSLLTPWRPGDDWRTAE